MPEPPVEPKFGVLLVHGMGDQKRGDTLLQFGEPMIKWIRRAISPSSPSDLVSEPRIMDSEVIRPHRQDLGAPAHLTLRWTAAADKPLLLAESWWAADFRPASFLDVVQWGVRIAPFVLSDTLRHQRRELNRKAFLWNGQLLATFLLGPVVHMVLLLLVPLSYFPFLRGFMGNIIQRLANSFGDPYLLLSSPVRFSSMVERIHQDIRWMNEQGCAQIAIVAHSQGASVSHRALKTLPADTGVKIRRYVTFGAAIKKLYVLGQVDYEGGSRLRLGIINTVVALAMLVTVLFGWRVVDATYSGWLVLAIWAAGTLIYWAVASREAESFNGDDALKPWTNFSTEPGKPEAWLDFPARADPVSLGELPLSGTDCVSKEIRNRDSIPNDHTYYWRNPEQFVGPVCHALMTDAGWPISGRPALAEAEMVERAANRAKRVDRLNVAFIVASLSWLITVAVFWAAERLDDVGTPIREAGELAGDELAIPFEGFVKSSIGNGTVALWVYGALALLIVTVAWYSGVTTGMWERWNSTQTDKSFTNPNVDPAEGRGWFFFAAGLTPVVVGGTAYLISSFW